MVKVKGARPSDSKVQSPKPRIEYLALFDYNGIMLSHSNVSQIESGKYVALLTAVARQCTMYRTVVLNDIPDEHNAERRLRKWVKKFANHIK